LVLALDISLSVDLNEHRLQRDGLAAALLDEAVVEAFLAGGGYVDLAVFEWSGQYDQSLIVNWTRIENRAVLEGVATRLIEVPQSDRTGRTGLGAAMLYARDMLAQRAACQTLTLDVSGDGPNNNGPSPERLHRLMSERGITVNALVIEGAVQTDALHLGAYFRDRVISGPQAFAEVITGFDAYKPAMISKLLRELAPALSQRAGPRRFAALER
jgi:hypothetical protein